MAIPGTAPTYCGRFAPSPTGPLHFGSLVAALASYLDARWHRGRWLLRIDNIDPAREVPGAAAGIQRTLEAIGLTWDGPVQMQSERMDRYREALERLARRGATFPCGCSRREVAATGRRGPGGPIYPGTCRGGLPAGRKPRVIRLRTEAARARFVDAIQGEVSCCLDTAVGDFVIRRADGGVAYHLAAAVDDGDPVITHVVRGADLLDSTAPQLHLMKLLGLQPPVYMHLPVAINRAGQKLSKQTHARALEPAEAGRLLHQALTFLRQEPPRELLGTPPRELLHWAVPHWNPAPLRGIREVAAPDTP